MCMAVSVFLLTCLYICVLFVVLKSYRIQKLLNIILTNKGLLLEKFSKSVCLYVCCTYISTSNFIVKTENSLIPKSVLNIRLDTSVLTLKMWLRKKERKKCDFAVATSLNDKTTPSPFTGHQVILLVSWDHVWLVQLSARWFPSAAERRTDASLSRHWWVD